MIVTDDVEGGHTSYNISLSPEYLQKIIDRRKHTLLKDRINTEKQSMHAQDYVRMKMEINKRLNQLTNDTRMIKTISDTLSSQKHSYTFVELFTQRILEQSVVQVSRYQDSYRQYALLFKILYSEQLFDYYRMCILSRKTDENGLKGLYSVYFGVLMVCDKADEAWEFVAGLLNSDMQAGNFVVLEVYLQILGRFLLDVVGSYGMKLIRYVRKHVIVEAPDPSQKHRLLELVNKLDK